MRIIGNKTAHQVKGQKKDVSEEVVWLCLCWLFGSGAVEGTLGIT